MSANNNQQPQHVVAETDAKGPHGAPYDPRKVGGPLHRRMDHSFLQYASYVIRDRAIPKPRRTAEAGAVVK